MLIDTKELDTAFRSCLYDNDEIKEPGKVPADAVVVPGITRTFGFHPGRLEATREKVRGWLDALPETFKQNSGGGYTFLAACEDKEGNQWGEHQNMEQLFCLGIGLKLAEYCAPREVWSVLPGGMPYIVVKI